MSTPTRAEELVMRTRVVKLYGLLPATYRLRDQEMGSPLLSLIKVIAYQIAAVQEGIDQAYDDLFIETCAEWVVPYIGDLVGARPLRIPAGTKVSQRADIANTLALRRRKGTLPVLEELARDVTTWPCVAVEYFQVLATTQHMKHLRPSNTLAHVRDRLALEQIDSAFDRMAHTFEARRIVTGRGRYNIPNIGLFLFRLRPLPLRGVNAYRVDNFRYKFDPLGIDQPLFTLPQAERSLADLAEPINVPVPITRLLMKSDKTAYYSPGPSIVLTVAGTAIPESKVRVCDLSDVGTAWANAPTDGYGIDPVLGRIALPTNDPAPAPNEVVVTYHYGAADAIGGGAYDRSVPKAQGSEAILSNGTGLQAALTNAGANPVIRFSDSRTYGIATAAQNLSIGTDQSVFLLARDGERPLIAIAGTELVIDTASGSELTLSGLAISGGALRIRGQLAKLVLDHCTLVPLGPTPPSLIIESARVRVSIEACIVGGVRIPNTALANVTRSVIDATIADGIVWADPSDSTKPGGGVSFEKCTIVGQVRTQVLNASSCIFMADAPAGTPPVNAAQMQVGCLRYSYLPLTSHTPSRYRCQPTQEQPDVRPLFTTLRFGRPGYAQLHPGCPGEIRQGGDDDSEMGVYHDLYQFHRESNLRLRLEEYLRFGLEAGILYAT